MYDLKFHTLCAVVSDYVPKSVRFPARVGVAGMTAVMFLGLLKTATVGSGIGGSIKELWKKKE
jgi:hypothetical protein